MVGPVSSRLPDWEADRRDDRSPSFSIFSLGSSFCSVDSAGVGDRYCAGSARGEAAAPSESDAGRSLSLLSSEVGPDSAPRLRWYWKSSSCSCVEPAVVGVGRRAESWPALVAALVAALLGTVLLVLLMAPLVRQVVDVADRGVVDGTMTLRTQSSRCS